MSLRKHQNEEVKKEEHKYSMLGKALQDVLNVAAVLLCPDLIAYRVKLRPILDSVIGKQQSVLPITIDRSKLFKQAISFYKTTKSNTHVQLMVSFRTDGVEEEGLDGSGLRREFYSAFFKECLSKLFVGKPRRKLPTNDFHYVHSGAFEALGRAIVASILNGDCGFPYLAPVVFYYLIDEDLTPHLTIQDVPDKDIKQLAEKLLDAKSNDDILAVLDSGEACVIDHIGWPSGKSFTMKTRDLLVQQLARWSIIDKRKTALDKLKEGLSHMGFLEATKRNEQLLPLFVFSSQYSVSADYLRKKILPQIQQMACSDDSQRKSKQYMMEYLSEISDEDAQSLFQFITGTVDPPIEEENIDVDFNLFNKSQKMPEANTCHSKLWLPQANTNSSEFKKSFKSALEHAKQGFGNS